MAAKYSSGHFECHLPRFIFDESIIARDRHALFTIAIVDFLVNVDIRWFRLILLGSVGSPNQDKHGEDYRYVHSSIRCQARRPQQFLEELTKPVKVGFGITFLQFADHR